MEIENINISLIFYAAFRNQACEDKFQELIKDVNLSSDVMIGGKLYNANFTSTIIKLDFPNFNSDRKRKNNIIYVTELAMVMSWKSCAWYEKNEERCYLYAKYYRIVDEWCLNHFKGQDLQYYINTTD